MTPTTQLLIDLFVKATILLGAAHLIAFTLRSRSAGTRHLVLSSALIALLVLPLTTPLLSVIEIAVFPAESVEAPVPIPAERLKLRTAPSEPDTFGAAKVETTSPSASAPELDPVSTAGVGGLDTPEDEVSLPLISMNAMQSWGRSTMTPSTLLLSVWLIGSMFLLIHLLTGVLRVQWIVERALPLRDEATLRLVDDTIARIGLDHRPAVLISPDLSVPVVWGLSRASLLLPLESEKWSEDRKRAVLLHELAHVERRDGLTLILSKLAIAIYWMNPLAWTAARMARRYCERACDDVVLERGTRASEYADHLLAIARTLPNREQLATVTLAMSRRSEIEGRLLAILHPDLRRGSISRRAAFVAVVLSMAIVASVSSFRLTAEENDPPTEPQIVETGDEIDPDLEIAVQSERDALASFEEDDYEPDWEVEWEAEDPDPDFNFNFDTAWNVDTSSSSNANWNVNTNSNYNTNWNVNVSNDEQHRRRTEVREKRKHQQEQSEGARVWEMAWNAHQEDRFDESIPLFMKSAELDYRPDASRYNVACGYAMQGDAANAVAWLGRAVDHGFDDWELLAEDSDLDPIRSTPEFQSFRATLPAREKRDVRSQDKETKIMNRFAELRDENSGDASDWAEVGRLLLGLRSFNEAEVALKNAIRFSDDPPVISMYNMACLEALRGNQQSALGWLDRAVEAGLDRTEKMVNDPDLESLRGTPSFDAIVKKSKMLSLDRFTDQMRGDEPLARRVERWAPAIAQFTRYTSAYPESGRAWWNLAWAQHMSGMYAVAIDSFERAHRLDYRAANSAYNIACGHARLGHHDLARQWLEKASRAGFELGDRIHWDEDLASLRSDARITALFEQRHRKSEK